MNVDLLPAVKTRLNFEHLYSDGGTRTLSELAQSKLIKLKTGCLYRRELALLGPDEIERRDMVRSLIEMESQRLWTLLEA
jgi:hypothetical protein